MRRTGATLAALWLACAPALAETTHLLIGFASGQGPEFDAAPDFIAQAGRRLSAETTYEEAGLFMASRLGAFLPGAPRIEVRLEPGASSLVAARRLLADDAGMLALLGPQAVFAPLIDASVAPWRPSDMQWIGALRRDDDVCVARASAPASNAREFLAAHLFVGSLAPGSRGFINVRALMALANARFASVSGYQSDFELARAFETGEIDATCGWSMRALRERHEEWLRAGLARPVLQFTLTRAGEGLALPSAEDFARDANAAAALRAIAAQTWFGGFALAMSPRAPASRLADYRAAFDAMTRDPETLTLAGGRGWTIDPVAGEALQARAVGLAAASDADRALLKSVLRGY